MKFSVLIPVYNVEKYLDQCLNSVLMQDYSDFEVILVNDGSTDKSPSICREYAEKDKRIKYFDKKNEGLLLTRRFSIKQASGEYIVFLDSDDFWEQGILSKLSKEIEYTDVDMICYRFRIVNDNGDTIHEDVDLFPDRMLFNKDNKEVFMRAFLGTTRLNNIWIKCVKSTIVDRDTDYRPFEDKKGEDILQSIALIRNAKLILYLNDVFVNYRMSPSGRGRNFKLKYVDDYDSVKQYVYSNLMKMDVSDSVMNIFYTQYIERLMSHMGPIVASVKNLQSFISECKHIENFVLYQKTSKTVSPREIAFFGRSDYINIKKHRYFLIYCNHRIRNVGRKTMSHLYRRERT